MLDTTNTADLRLALPDLIRSVDSEDFERRQRTTLSSLLIGTRALAAFNTASDSCEGAVQTASVDVKSYLISLTEDLKLILQRSALLQKRAVCASAECKIRSAHSGPV